MPKFIQKCFRVIGAFFIVPHFYVFSYIYIYLSDSYNLKIQLFLVVPHQIVDNGGIVNRNINIDKIQLC